MTIYRVRKISCDGNRLGRVWSEEFFYVELVAANRLTELIIDSDKQNPKYPFSTTAVSVEGVVGFCNWQFGIMVVKDSVEVH